MECLLGRLRSVMSSTRASTRGGAPAPSWSHDTVALALPLCPSLRRYRVSNVAPSAARPDVLGATFLQRGRRYPGVARNPSPLAPVRCTQASAAAPDWWQPACPRQSPGLCRCLPPRRWFGSALRSPPERLFVPGRATRVRRRGAVPARTNRPAPGQWPAVGPARVSPRCAQPGPRRPSPCRHLSMPRSRSWIRTGS